MIVSPALRLLHRADVRDDVADLARPELVGLDLAELVVADFGDLVRLTAPGGELDLRARLDRAVDYAHARNRAAVFVVVRVEDQRAEGRVGVSARRRHALDNRLEERVDADAFLGADEEDVVRIGADEIVHLLLAALGLGAGQVDLVEDRDDLEARVECEEEIRQRLRLDALRRVDDEDGAFARRQRARDLVGEVHVAGRVDQVELELLAALGGVTHPHGVELDGDAALTLEVERVEDLLLHLALLERAGGLDQPVGQRRLAVVDVGDDAEVADVIELQCGLSETMDAARETVAPTEYSGSSRLARDHPLAGGLPPVEPDEELDAGGGERGASTRGASTCVGGATRGADSTRGGATRGLSPLGTGRV